MLKWKKRNFAVLLLSLVAVPIAKADPISYVTTGNFNPGDTVATSNGFAITYNPATNTSANNGDNVPLGSFLLSGTNALGTGDFSNVAFTLTINQLTPVGVASGTADFTGTVASGSNVLLMSFGAQPLVIHGNGIDYDYYINSQTNPLYSSTYSVALPLNSRATLDGVLYETATVPEPASMAIVGIPAAAALLRRRRRVV